jgi:ketosteroid isomerase-like protein
MKELVKKLAGNGGLVVVLALLLLAVAAPTAAQKNKGKQKQAPTAEPPPDAKPMLLQPDSEAIDQTIGESLGYWQIGDVDSLHKYYADDVVVVSGASEPPVIGWDNYVKAYQAQRARVTGGRMDRTNTLVKVNGDSAWATYQFYYVATVEGNIMEFRGHTTLILNKRGNRWVIALNHSSISDSTTASPAPVAGSTQPGQP